MANNLDIMVRHMYNRIENKLYKDSGDCHFINFLGVQGSGIFQYILLKVKTCYCTLNILPLRKKSLQTLQREYNTCENATLIH